MEIIELLLDEENDVTGIEAVSIVEAPAIESDFITLKSQEIQLAKVDDEKKILMGAALIPNKPIYRKQGEKEYYVYFSNETVRKASELFFKNGNQNNATLEHKLAINDLTVVESWIVENKEKDKTALYGLDVPEGTWMISMKATNESNNTAGFHISELYSVWSTWSQMATNFLEAKKNPETLKTFINTALGESWEEQGDAVEYDTLLQRRLSYDKTNVPEDVLVITAGVDTQKDRLECQLVGWGKNYEAWVLDYKIFWGDPNAFNVWQDLDVYLKKRYKTETDRIIPISCACLDSGGHHTNMVYQFTKPRQARRIFAIKGLSQAGKPIANRPTFVGKNKAVLYGVDPKFTFTVLPEPCLFLILASFISFRYSALYLSLNVISSSIDILDKDLPAIDIED